MMSYVSSVLRKRGTSINTKSKFLFRTIERPNKYVAIIYSLFSACLVWPDFISTMINERMTFILNNLDVEFVFFGIVVPLVLLFGKMIIEVRDDGIYYRFFPVHRKLKGIKYNNIEEYKVFESNSRLSIFGIFIWVWWLYRFSSMYKIAGDNGIRITLKKGHEIFLGTNKSKEIGILLDRFSRIE